MRYAISEGLTNTLRPMHQSDGSNLTIRQFQIGYRSQPGSQLHGLTGFHVRQPCQPLMASPASMISKLCSMAAVLPNMALAEQYFSAERVTARSTLAGFSLYPVIL